MTATPFPRLQVNLVEYNSLIAAMEEKRQRNISSHSENQPHEKPSVSENKIADISAGISGTDGASGGDSSIYEKIADAAMEVTAQPHIAPMSGKVVAIIMILNERTMNLCHSATHVRLIFAE